MYTNLTFINVGCFCTNLVYIICINSAYQNFFVFDAYRVLLNPCLLGSLNFFNTMLFQKPLFSSHKFCGFYRESLNPCSIACFNISLSDYGRNMGQPVKQHVCTAFLKSVSEISSNLFRKVVVTLKL